MYPGLFKPIILRNSEYNQHVSKAACIIEVRSNRKYIRRKYWSNEIFSKDNTKYKWVISLFQFYNKNYK